MWESNGTFVQQEDALAHLVHGITQAAGMFPLEKAVISHGQIFQLEAEVMREMTDFGVLPTPKLTEEQEMGYTHTDCMFTSLLLPSYLSEEDARMSATVTNALNAFSHEYVIPTYYETILKTKLTRDEDSPRMMDLILEGRRYSFDYMGENDFPITHINMLRQRLGDQRTGLAGMYKANEKRTLKWIEDYVEMIKNMD